MRSARAAVERRCATTIDRAAVHQPLERPLDLVLGAGVEVRRRLVEHEHRRVGERGARERDELALPRRQPRAALAHLGVEPVGERARTGRAARARASACSTSASVASGRPTAHVVAQRAREQEALLRHDDDALAQRVRTSRRGGRRRRRAPRPRPGRRSARSASRASTCPRRSGPTSASRSPGGDVQRRRRAAPARSVPYANVTSSTSISPPRGRSTAPGRSSTVGLGVEHAEDLLQRRAGRLHGVVELAELVDRLEQVVAGRARTRRPCRP